MLTALLVQHGIIQLEDVYPLVSSYFTIWSLYVLVEDLTQ
jgi:hypothetical protein